MAAGDLGSEELLMPEKALATAAIWAAFAVANFALARMRFDKDQDGCSVTLMQLLIVAGCVIATIAVWH